MYIENLYERTHTHTHKQKLQQQKKTKKKENNTIKHHSLLFICVAYKI
jgi:hypothetical protein